MKVSVIIPIYKVEKYINRCVDSIIQQSYSDLEIILVDDGSPDSCPEICDKYERVDSRVTVIHKTNGGLPSARNAGIEIATGDYILFVDSDDYCEKDMIEYLLELATEYSADISCCGIIRKYVSSGKEFATRSFDKPIVLSQEESLNVYFLADFVTTAVWNKLFKREVIQDLRYKDYRRNEDAWFVCNAILKSKNMVVGEKQLYHYEVRDNSITRGNFGVTNKQILEETDECYFKIIAKYPDNKVAIVAKIFWYTVYVDEMIVAGAKEYSSIKKLQTLIRENYKNINKYPYFSFIRKSQYYILSISFNVYRLCYKVYGRINGKF